MTATATETPTTDPTTPTTPDAPTQPLDVIQALYSAFGRGDMDAMLALIDDDVDWSRQVDGPGGDLVPMLRNGRGHAAVLHYFSGVAPLDIEVFTPKRFHLDGDVVIVELEFGFTHRETGKQALLDEIHRFTVRDGRVVHYRPYVDTALLIETYRP